MIALRPLRHSSRDCPLHGLRAAKRAAAAALSETRYPAGRVRLASLNGWHLNALLAPVSCSLWRGALPLTTRSRSTQTLAGRDLLWISAEHPQGEAERADDLSELVE